MPREQKFKAGDRVVCFGTYGRPDIEVLHRETCIVHFDGDGDDTQLFLEALHPLPTDAQKLRDAAEVCLGIPDNFLHPNEAKQCAQMVTGFKNLAARLEAASAPKPPLLREAVDPDILEAIADEIDCFEHSARAGSLRHLAKLQRAALSREEG